jgi:glutamyl-tRNA synthetase
MSGRPPRLRFAPSPTGVLHLGNARTALFNWLIARRQGGTLILRIEDTDTVRGVEGSEQGILDDLRWLGLDWDEGPDVGGPYGPYRQSERGASYREAVARLLESDRAYPCFCPEEEGREKTASGGAGYAGTCRSLDRSEARRRVEAGEPHAIRFRTIPRRPSTSDWTVHFVDRLRGPIEVPAADLGDPVLVRRDGRPTYNFAAVVDDSAMDVTMVVRGDDHLSNTPRQVLLYEALGKLPPEFVHLPMVRGPDGERLSKRHGAVSVREFRRMGVPPEAVINAIALLGWSPPGDRTLISLQEMAREFEVDRIGRSPAVFDPDKLEWISGQYLHRAEPSDLADAVADALTGAGLLPTPADGGDPEWFREVCALAQAGIMKVSQAPERLAGLFWGGGEPRGDEARSVLAEPGARAALLALLDAVTLDEPKDGEGWHRVAAAVGTRTGLRGKALFRPLRVAVTGEAKGPELDRLVPLVVRGAELHPASIASLPERIRKTLATVAG